MATDARIGSELAGYRIEAPIGRGGMGVVYRAEQLRLGRKVALKLLAPELAENEGFRARFEHESRLAAVLDHPNIVPLFEAGEADGLLFISMRYVEGTDLRELLSRDGRLEPERALAIAAQVASALDAAHERGLVHRDVKPGNILIASDVAPDRPEHCYLTDFGLTKDTSSPVELTATGTFVGTIDYIAPEQIEGAAAAGRGDQYALACVLFECLTGHLPFPRDEEISVMWAHLQDEPPTVTADASGAAPPPSTRSSRGALAKHPEERYATCTAMVAAARAALLPDAPSFPQQSHARTRARRRPPARPASTGPTPHRRGGARARAGSAAAAPTPPRPAARGRTAGGAAPGAARPPRHPPRRAAGTSPCAGRSSAAWPLSRSSWPWRAISPARAAVTSRPQPARWRPTTTSRWPTGRAGRRAASPTPSAGLELVAPITLQSGNARIVAGRIAHPGPGLLPVGVGAPGATGVVTLDRTPALRHTDLPAGAGASATVFVVSTRPGPRRSPASGPRPSGCEAVAATLRLKTGGALDIRPSKAYATALSAVLADHARREAPTAAPWRARGRRPRRAPRPPQRRAPRPRSPSGRANCPLRRRPPRPTPRSSPRSPGPRPATGASPRRPARTTPGRYGAAGAALRRAQARLAQAVAALKLLGYQRHGEMADMSTRLLLAPLVALVALGGSCRRARRGRRSTTTT